MGTFSKKLREDIELWLASLAIVAAMPPSDPGCRLVFPPGGRLLAGSRCGSPPDSKVHEAGHPYFGPTDIVVRTCESGHRHPVPAAGPDVRCQRCGVDSQFPGWRPSGKIGAWSCVPFDQRP
jgi:hypothetical protein